MRFYRLLSCNPLLQCDSITCMTLPYWIAQEQSCTYDIRRFSSIGLSSFMSQHHNNHRSSLWLSNKKMSFNIANILMPELILNERTSLGNQARTTTTTTTTQTMNDTEPRKPLLLWETFDFGSNPKLDERFDTSHIMTSSSDEEWNHVVQNEAKLDVAFATSQRNQIDAWEALDATLIQQATNALIPYVNTQRIARIRSVLDQRTNSCRFLFENPTNPSNVWACLRTIDSFGIQHVDVVINSAQYMGKSAVTQKRGMRTAMGSAHWLSIRHHMSTISAIQSIRQQQPNVRIYATDVNPKSRDIRTIDWCHEHTGPFCIVMGNESEGISDGMRHLVDETFYLPVRLIKIQVNQIMLYFFIVFC
jgi:tRNA G18 (ribose-2'-O)-methylase SpoU